MKGEMQPLLITRISGQLEHHFGGLIDMSDWATRPSADTKNAFLSRGLAAFCVKTLTSASLEAAASAVTDGFHDNGIDAIFFDQKSDLLVVVQSKWSGDGTSALDAKATLALAGGVTDLLNLRFDRFNDKVRSKEPEIKAALYSERVRLLVVTAHTANQEIAPYVRRNIDDLVGALNDPVKIAEALHLNQKGLYGLLTAESQPQKIKLQITLNEWGFIDKPFLAYYGRVHVNEVAQWWVEHGNTLFTHNLRLFYVNSDVNNALNMTLSNQHDNFWYFNNGVTVICDSISKAAAGSPGRQIGLFTCDGASIVNGAQTVGTIGRTWTTKRAGPTESDANAWVQVRIISLDNCPPEFSRRITRAANLQNAVGNREFAAMDSVQHRLATEFALDKRRYAYKQGESDPQGDEGCNIVETTQALACNHSIALAVQAKREIGALWADTATPPYTDLFNHETTGEAVWQSVQIMRTVDQQLQRLRSSTAPRADLIGFHLNRVILHLVFQDASLRGRRHKLELAECLARVEEVTSVVFGEVAEYVEKHHKDEYPAPLSKNLTKCEELVRSLRPAGQGRTGDLFA
jgi:hypothetical protein